jgi:hypothetical protein
MTAALETQVPAPAQPAPATEEAPAFDGHGPFVLAFTMFAVLVVIAAVLWK